MRLSDIMAQMQLSHYAEIGLIIFLLVFIAITIRLFFFTPKEELTHAALLPMAGQDAAPQAKKLDSGDLQA